MGKFSLSKIVCIAFLFCAATVIASPAQTFTTLVNFAQTNGADSVAPLIQGTDGNFYGTTESGGVNTNNCTGGCGVVFNMTPGGTLTALYSFCSQPGCTDGSSPVAALVQATDGNFYGTTLFGGVNDAGTIFKITAAGALTTIYSFCSQTSCPDGSLPNSTLVQGNDGNFYGTTQSGGYSSYYYPYPNGTVFKITPTGTLTTLLSFYSTYYYSGDPIALVQGSDGNFYGTTSADGRYFGGSVFKITPEGKATTLYSFCAQRDCTDGAHPEAGLVQSSDGNFYGTTVVGGAYCGFPGCGTVFKITPGGTLTTLHSFDKNDGADPAAGLVQATDGNFYGSTEGGGAHYYYGTVFKITPGGTLTTLHSFDLIPDGAAPLAGLLQATDGNFYGSTSEYGGISSQCVPYCGTVFRLSVGLDPFVEIEPTSGIVGTPVTILGTNLTSATGVSFNGAPAPFNVVSDSEITTAVPAAATTGPVQVTTHGGVLLSNMVFQVTPSITIFTPRIGRVGTSVVISGGGLKGTTSVTFGGIKAKSFTVESPTEIRATVPAGARTGKIGVTTPDGKATSAGTFTVL